MIGDHAFCPTSGASLSEESHYDERGVPQRAPATDDPVPLTTGGTRSSRRALLRYFRRCHRRHADPDGKLYGRASLALARLKRTANAREGRDEIVWYALGERLARHGFEVAWMHAHAEPRCPDCGGRLAFERGPSGLVARCGLSCAHGGDRLDEIRGLVASLHERAFPDEPTPPTDDLHVL
ncbi:hypothetical protein [Saliphagus infecundisoli]|uniref:Uncharacterized protein n=1 Tax=Saliphagus infecundisoli TaxID=1849069 RepID=A0ABD5QL89_9EURY|nr:hypothetical protein [Saliphagus infecundisoli]